MHVLKSSGFFLQRQVMRLTAAVTTPCRGRRVAGQGPRGRIRLGTSVQAVVLRVEAQEHLGLGWPEGCAWVCTGVLVAVSRLGDHEGLEHWG